MIDSKTNIDVLIKRLSNGLDLPLPGYQSNQAAGMDLYAALDEQLVLSPGSYALVPTGIAIHLPKNFEAQIRPRSGLAVKFGITVLNTPGTIDSDYRGEIKVIIINLGKESYTVQHGDRIAQMIIKPVIQANVVLSEILPESERGSSGFGSTGNN